MTSKQTKIVDQGEILAFWRDIDARIDAGISRGLKLAAQNPVARGPTSIALVVGTPGVPLVANAIQPYMHVVVDWPLSISKVHIVAGDATVNVYSATFDIWVQRNAAGVAQPTSGAASIVAPNYPALVSEQEHYYYPILAGQAPNPLGDSPVWSSTYIEPGSVIWLWVTAADGLVQVVTVNLGGRAVGPS